MSVVAGRTRVGVLTLFVCASSLLGGTPRTFCNPLNLDYGLRTKGTSPLHRHGADPCIVLFKDRYYLFSTWDKPGYRVSDDLLSWKYIPFAEGSELAMRTYTAAAVIIMSAVAPFEKETRPMRFTCPSARAVSRRPAKFCTAPSAAW